MLLVNILEKIINMNTFRIQGTIITSLEPDLWWKFFNEFLNNDKFISDIPSLFKKEEDLIKLSEQKFDNQNYGFLNITEEERIEIDKFFDELDNKGSINDRI